MGSSALLLASRSGLLTTVNELLKKEVDVNVQNEVNKRNLYDICVG